MTVNPQPGLSTDAAPDNGARSQRIGALLRRTREGRRIGLGDVAASLRIRANYLEAIEQGTPQRLPGPTYAVGFVRAYAEYLGLDGEEAVRRFKREGQGLDGQPDLSFPVPIAERSIPGGRILVTAVVLAICGYGLWYYQTSPTHRQPSTVAEVPAALLAAPPVDSKDPASPGEARASVPTPPKNAIATATAPRQVAALTPPTLQPPAAPPPAQPAAAPADAAAEPGGDPDSGASRHAFGQADGPARIVLRFTDDCWVQIRDAKQDIVFGKLLHAGDVYRVPDQAGLTIKVGNSDGLDILVDGKAVTLPPANSRVRNIALDPARLSANDPTVSVPVAVPPASPRVD